MKELFGIPVVESEEVQPETIYVLPQVRPVVYVPLGGFKSREEDLSAIQAALIEAHVQAARRGETGVIRNVKL